MPVDEVEIKTSTMHVEAAIPVVLGRGFNSLRLHSTRPSTASLMAGRASAESNALSKRSASKGFFVHAGHSVTGVLSIRGAFCRALARIEVNECSISNKTGF